MARPYGKKADDAERGKTAPAAHRILKCVRQETEDRKRMKRQRYQRLLAGVLALLTVVSVLFWKPSDVFAEAGSDGEALSLIHI